MAGFSGVKYLTASGALGTSQDALNARPVRVYTISLMSGVGTAGLVELYSGQSSSGDKYYQARALGSSQSVDDIAGMLFEDGCWCEITGAGQKVAISYSVEPA